MNRVFLYTLVGSVLAHLLLALLFELKFNRDALPTPNHPPEKTALDIAITYKVDDAPPPPEHNTDDPTQANNQRGTAHRPSAVSAKPTQASNGQPNQANPQSPRTTEPQKAAQRSVITTEKQTPADRVSSPRQQATPKRSLPDSVSPHQPTSPQAATTDLQEQHLSTPLSDSELEDTAVENPLDQQEQALKKWYNEVYKRLTAQVMAVWVKPDDSEPNQHGVIRLEVDINGYLNRAWVHLPSGHRGLDQSALNAVRSIIRYQLPESPNMARYYLNLELRYSGGEDRLPESLPSAAAH